MSQSESNPDEQGLETLARIETKIDNLNNNFMKIIYALLAMVGAVIGVEFWPKSPIDWEGGLTYGSAFLTIFAFLFLAGRLWYAKRNGNSRTTAFVLGVLLIVVHSALNLVMHALSMHEMLNPVLIVVRLALSGLLLWYGWSCCEAITQVETKT